MKSWFCTLLFALFILPTSLFAGEMVNDSIEVTFIDPEEGDTLSGFNKGDSIIFTTNVDSICGGFKVSVVDKQEHAVLYEDFTSSKNEDGKWVFFFYDDVVFLKGGVYSIEIEGHENNSSKSDVIGLASTFYIGSTEIEDDDEDDYEYSNVKMVSISPEEGSELTLLYLNFAVVVYTDDVVIDGDKSVIIDEDGNEIPFEVLIGINGSQRHWQLVIPISVMLNCTSSITLHIHAKDKMGHVVKGNKGKGEHSYYEITYTCYMGFPKMVISPDEGYQTVIDNFAFSCEKGIDVKNMDAELLIYSEDKTSVLRSIKGSDIVEKDSVSLEATLEDGIQTLGTYYLYVPKGIFGLGQKNIDNWETWVEYNVVERIDKYGVTLDPEDGSEVSKLSQIIITFDRWNAAIPYYNNKDTIRVYDENGFVVTDARATYDSNRTKYNQCIINLNKPVTTAGKYRLDIPEYAFILDESAKYHSEHMYFEYTIPEKPDYSQDVTVSTYVDSLGCLSGVKLKFDKYTIVGYVNANTNVDLTDSLGNIVASGVLRLGQFKNEIYVQIDDSWHLSSEGDYLLGIPANTLKFDGDVYNKDLVINVHYDPTTGLDFASTEHKEMIKVYNLQGQLIREGYNDDTMKGLKGLFIINGKKILIK